MRGKFIVHVHDPTITIGEAIALLNRLDYDEAPFEPICAWRLGRGYAVSADASKNKDSIRFDIWRTRQP